MPATLPHEIEIDTVLLECEPFEWPRSNWEPLLLVISERTGWATLTDAAALALNALYNGAHGSVVDGPTGLIVQYLQGTGGGSFTVTDWRSNTGSFVFWPDEGFVINEVALDETGDTFYTANIKLVRMS